jgi:aldehyde:ferredoxin oxidoreductase
MFSPTGLRTYFHAYSPLKRSSSGLPSAMWSTGSGKFGTKLRFLDATALLGQNTNAKIQSLHSQYLDAHFAVIGPAAENYEAVLYAAKVSGTSRIVFLERVPAPLCG